MTLANLREVAQRSEELFENAIRIKYPRGDRWVWFRSLDKVAAGNGDKWDIEMANDQDIMNAYNQYIKDLHAYYLLRDGPNGVLGSKGL